MGRQFAGQFWRLFLFSCSSPGECLGELTWLGAPLFCGPSAVFLCLWRYAYSNSDVALVVSACRALGTPLHTLLWSGWEQVCPEMQPSSLMMTNVQWQVLHSTFQVDQPVTLFVVQILIGVLHWMVMTKPMPMGMGCMVPGIHRCWQEARPVGPVDPQEE